jgi:uncharacterized 2Fe-2S/4Fe-4S cluster protein (DUF4445 family)
MADLQAIVKAIYHFKNAKARRITDLTKPQLQRFGKTQKITNCSSEPQLLIDLLDDAGIDWESPCAGTGTCGKCRVQILNGECIAAKPGPEEKALLSQGDLDVGLRLACYCLVRGEVSLRIEQPAREIRVLERGLAPHYKLEHIIHKKILSLEQKNHEEISLYEQIINQLKPNAVSASSIVDILRLLGEINRVEYLTAIFNDKSLIGLELNDTTKDCYGLALDIGTTTVVASLHNLSDGRELAVTSALNPQIQYGFDVLSRIYYAQQHPSGLKKLNNSIIECLNRIIAELCEQSGVKLLHIYEIVVAANTVMMHLFLGVSPTAIGRTPYKPVFRQKQMVAANMLGIEASPFATVYCLPSVSGFVGSDIVAGIIASELDKEKGTVLFLDLGTNGEIVLYKDKKLIVCSTAVGPALEGMNIACGMRASKGAVEKVWLKNNAIFWETICDSPPQGLCGSGLLDLVAVMLDSGLLNSSGRIAEQGKFLELCPQSPLAQQLDEVNGKRRFWLIPPLGNGQNGIFITQADIRQVQLAKSAIVTGSKILLGKAGISEKEINKVYLAGAFGVHLHPASLIRLGFLPETWREHISFVGNTSRAGAVMALLSRSTRKRMEKIASQADYIKLESSPDFKKIFVQNMSFLNP